MRGESGSSVLALVQGLAAFSLLLALAAGALAPAANARQVDAAARTLAAAMREAGARAMAEQRDVAIVFAATGLGEPICIASDQDGDGISRADIADGVDACGPTFTLAREQSAARVAPPPWPSVAAPSAGGSRLLGAGPALRFGASRLAVFTPDGDASPGSVTITDGRDHLCAVVVSGAGGRVRSLCYDRTGDRWRAR